MKKSLITYSTVDGQTKEICEKISELSKTLDLIDQKTRKPQKLYIKILGKRI